ncbi:hypothetical protein WA026_022907 [Henosepilachna vigintioctopunctata]|uniref:C2H2-type domain-containing protein n=1 Tax=Henosepilachna vigintioctopunctata TaxID=420089 RepID=A0AAW1TY17_9CUCU
MFINKYFSNFREINSEIEYTPRRSVSRNSESSGSETSLSSGMHSSTRYIRHIKEQNSIYFRTHSDPNKELTLATTSSGENDSDPTSMSDPSESIPTFNQQNNNQTENNDIIPGPSGHGNQTQNSDTLIQDDGYMIELSCKRNKTWNRRYCCSICNKNVTNFSRHLFRNHFDNESVRKKQDLPKGNNERKNLIDYLRKQGNISIYSEKVIRPKQRPSKATKNTVQSSDYLPCKHRNDHSAAKRDTIACQYAEEYLKKHKRPHIKNLVANELREVGRLLIPLQDIYKLDSLLEALKPENFEKVVSAGKIISGYDETNKSFKAPSLALHFRTTILAVCSAAKTLVLKKDPVVPITNHEIT